MPGCRHQLVDSGEPAESNDADGESAVGEHGEGVCGRVHTTHDTPAAMEPELDRAAVARFIEAAGARLTGEWLLLGGAVAALWFDATRLTEDIDMIGLGGTTVERLALMDLAVQEGLSVEVVNSAADFFVRRVPGWEHELALLHAGPSATIHRPSPTLFLLLKLGRLSEKDLGDCAELVRFIGVAEIDVGRVLGALDALPPSPDAALMHRRAHLRAVLLG